VSSQMTIGVIPKLSNHFVWDSQGQRLIQADVENYSVYGSTQP
jgi:hypothetical protein